MGAVIYTFRDMGEPVFEELKKTTSKVLFGICVMSFCYELLEGAVTFILGRCYNADFRYRWGVESAFLCAFYKVATLGSGTGVASLCNLVRHGVGYSESFGLSMLSFAFHRLSIAVFSAVFFLLSREFMVLYYGNYLWLLAAGCALQIAVTIVVILFCCSVTFHWLIFRILGCFQRWERVKHIVKELKYQCEGLEQSSSYLLKKKKGIAGMFLLDLIKLGFWYAIPYVALSGGGRLGFAEAAAVTAMSVMLASAIPAPAGIGSTEFVFILLFEKTVGAGPAGSALLLYRFATFVFPFFVGFLFFAARHVRKEREKKAETVR